MKRLFIVIFCFVLSNFISPVLSAKERTSQRGESTTNLQELVGKSIYILSVNGQSFDGGNIGNGYLAYYYVYAVADTSKIQIKKKYLAREKIGLNGALTVVRTFGIDMGKKHEECIGLLVKDDSRNFYAVKIPLWVGSYPYNGASKKVWEHIENPEIEFIDSRPYCCIESLYKDSVVYKISKNYRCKAVGRKTSFVGFVYDAKYTKRMKMYFNNDGKLEIVSCKQSDGDYDNYYDINRFSDDFATQYELKKRCVEEYGKSYEDSIVKALKGHFWYIEKTPSKCYHYKDSGFYHVKEGDYRFESICLKEPLMSQSREYVNPYKYHLKFSHGSDTIEFYLNPQTDIMDYLVDTDTHNKEIQTERAKEKQEEMLEKQREAREERIYRQRLVQKYGAKNAALILGEQVRIGFTKEMCVESWGEPQYVNSTITRYGKQEQWVYGIGCYLYFARNKLVGIQNVE